MINESRDSVGEIPSPKITKVVVRATKFNNRHIYMYYELVHICVTNRGGFVLLQIRANIVTNWGSFDITHWNVLLQIRATFITKYGSYYNFEVILFEIGTGIANQGNYYKFGHNTMSFA